MCVRVRFHPKRENGAAASRPTVAGSGITRFSSTVCRVLTVCCCCCWSYCCSLSLSRFLSDVLVRSYAGGQSEKASVSSVTVQRWCRRGGRMDGLSWIGSKTTVLLECFNNALDTHRAEKQEKSTVAHEAPRILCDGIGSGKAGRKMPPKLVAKARFLAICAGKTDRLCVSPLFCSVTLLHPATLPIGVCVCSPTAPF